MNITICGGGNLGHACAAFLSAQEGCCITMLSRRPQEWDKELKCTLPDGASLIGRLSNITGSYYEAIPEADMVLICLPGFAIEEELQKMKGFLQPGTPLGSVVCSTGFFFFAHNVLPASQPLFGFQRVPFICRTIEYGKAASISGTKKQLFAALENLEPGFCDVLGKLFRTPVSQLDSHYEASLSNSNPLLHTSRLYTMWGKWDGKPMQAQELFYEGWTDEASKVYIAMDEELQNMLKSIGIRNGAIPTVLEYYESTDAQGLTRKLRSIEAFKGISSPLKVVPGGYIPDFTSRYFTEDFPYGLRFARELAHTHGIPCPVMDRVYEWGTACVAKGERP